jgi:hypothetical protein
MLSDKINRLPLNRADSPSINSFDDQNAVILVNKQGNILSFEHSRRNSGASVNKERPETSTPPPSSKPIAYNLNGLTAELEKRRAELVSLARAAETRAKEAEEKCEQAESILEQELNQRLLAEQRLRELEEGRLRQLQAIDAEGAGATTAALAYGETGVRLKEAEGWAKETGSEIETLTVALMEAEQRRIKAETFAQAADDKAREFESLYAETSARVKDLEARLNGALAKAREEAEGRRAAERSLLEIENKGEAVARAMSESETVRNALVEANRKVAEAGTAARSAEEKARTFESLLVEAESAGRQATERCQAIEAEMHREVKQRAMAEQKLKEFEDELSSYLELDWSKGGPDPAPVGVARAIGRNEEVVSQLQAQIEVERKARQEAEEARAAFELKIWDMDRALRVAEENNRQIAALNLVKSADGDQTYTVKKQKGFRHEFKFIVYGMAISLLLVALIALIAAASFQV